MAEENERPMADQLARQILRDDRDLQWLHPLAREYQKLVERAERHEEKMLMLQPLIDAADKGAGA